MRINKEGVIQRGGYQLGDTKTISPTLDDSKNFYELHCLSFKGRQQAPINYSDLLSKRVIKQIANVGLFINVKLDDCFNK